MYRLRARGRRTGAASLVSISLALVAIAAPTSASRDDRGHRSFQHVGTFDVSRNGNEVAEIVDATKDGKQLVYTDSATGSVGFVDITNPVRPAAGRQPRRSAALPPASASPRSTRSSRSTPAPATSTTPPARSSVVDLATRAIVKTLPLGGQPDSVAISPDEKYAADRAGEPARRGRERRPHPAAARRPAGRDRAARARRTGGHSGTSTSPACR